VFYALGTGIMGAILTHNFSTNGRSIIIGTNAAGFTLFFFFFYCGHIWIN
jgi:hypothetical protein